MDIARAKELLSALADGIDPFTGELFPQNHVCNQPEMIRAFHEILNAIPAEKKEKSSPQRRKTLDRYRGRQVVGRIRHGNDNFCNCKSAWQKQGRY